MSRRQEMTFDDKELEVISSLVYLFLNPDSHIRIEKKVVEALAHKITEASVQYYRQFPVDLDVAG